MLLRENAPLREYCSMRVGGPARLAAFPETAEELAALLRAGGRRVVLGGGSNVLFPDEGYDGTVIFTTRLCGLTADGCMLSAQAGVPLSAAARRALECRAGGWQFAYGIPGTVGGGVYMNAGALRRLIADWPRLRRRRLHVAAGDQARRPRVRAGARLSQQRADGRRLDAFVGRFCSRSRPAGGNPRGKWSGICRPAAKSSRSNIQAAAAPSSGRRGSTRARSSSAAA